MLIGLLPWALILGMQGGQKGMSWLEMLDDDGHEFRRRLGICGGQPVGKTRCRFCSLPPLPFMINSRHILMGAAIAPYMRDMSLKKAMPALFVMCDESWAMAFAEIQKRKAAGLPAFQYAFFMPACALFCM